MRITAVYEWDNQEEQRKMMKQANGFIEQLKGLKYEVGEFKDNGVVIRTELEEERDETVGKKG